MKSFDNKGMSRRAQRKSAKRLAAYLSTGIDMEDRCTGTTYKDYVQRERWPANMPEEAFNEVREHLTILLEDSNRHKEMILTLKRMLKDQ